MIRSFNIAATGMIAMQYMVDVIAGNIANSNTTGYKSSRPNFSDLMYQTELRMGTLAAESGEKIPTGIQFGLGVAINSTSKDFKQGTLTPTGRKLDVAINGAGLFKVQLPNGDTAYTRDGGFQLNENGDIVTTSGFIVSPGINIPIEAGNNISISPDGTVQYTTLSSTTSIVAGQFDLATFNDLAGLDAIGGNLYLQTAASGDPTEGKPQDPNFGYIQQGWLEESNVEPITEIMKLIKAQRCYEMNSKVIQTSEQMERTATEAKA